MFLTLLGKCRTQPWHCHLFNCVIRFLFVFHYDPNHKMANDSIIYVVDSTMYGFHYSKNIHTCCLVIWRQVTHYTTLHQEKPRSNGLQTTFVTKTQSDMISNEQNESISTYQNGHPTKLSAIFFTRTRKENNIWCRPGHVGGMDCLFYITRDIPCYSIFVLSVFTTNTVCGFSSPCALAHYWHFLLQVHLVWGTLWFHLWRVQEFSDRWSWFVGTQVYVHMNTFWF